MIESSKRSPINVEIESNALHPFNVSVGAKFSDWVKIGVGIGGIIAFYRIAAEIGKALPYLKQIAENGIQK